ncbi:MAG: putative resolvase [Thermacetogenium sp.]|uniref:Resolvase n=1 Tax=Thermacetogenium phaeum TaxID=85874 RepID=A0A101FGE4_9THEO|nr:MAG: Resolvase [Thermacetogenium phaeum]MDN5366014.1 putative resolvase [Thermacetogenium sp.]MDN5375551.1 putative resolvase [Thermacetogenium sp.]
MIKSIRLPSGQRRYPAEEINRILGTGGIKAEQDAVVLYARVSTKKQADAGNLERQMERLRAYAQEKGYRIVGEHLDVASGLNQNRRGLERVLKMAERGEFKKLLIEYPDRLARFGYAYLERHLKHCGVEIEVTSQREPVDAHTELVQDLLTIVTSFSARLYGARGGRKVRQGFRELIEDAEKAQKGEV